MALAVLSPKALGQNSRYGERVIWQMGYDILPSDWIGARFV